MRQHLRRTAVIMSAALLSSVLSIAPALAAPTLVESDRSDTLMKLTYDASTGKKVSDSTWTRSGGNDDVLFRVVVVETEDSGTGLLGKLVLRLEGDKAHKYNGWFVLRLVDDSGNVAFHRALPSEIILRPKPGSRRSTIRFRFDVPSGSYTASGAFDA